VYEIGAEGLLGIERNSGEGRVDMFSDAIWLANSTACYKIR